MWRSPTFGLRSVQAAAIRSVRVGPCSPISAAPRSPQSRDLRVGSQLPLDIVTAGPEDNAGGAPGLELGETFAQLLSSARERHLFAGGHVGDRLVAVLNVEVMTAVNREVSNALAPPFDTPQPRFPIRQCF